MKDVRVAHSLRFRAFGNRYPRHVAEAYKGDLARAMSSTDKQVARMVLKLLRRSDAPARYVNTVARIAAGRGK